MEYDWQFLESFSHPQRSADTWADFEPWCELARGQADERAAELGARIGEWDQRLEWLGGDPSARDWRRFRPLPLRREEDWSDWLAELLESSGSGRLAAELLVPSDANAYRVYTSCRVLREARADKRRADIVLFTGSAAELCHIEVKINDRAFAKTVETSAMLSEKHRRATKTFVLLQEGAVDLWNEQAKRFGGEDVRVITWRDVAVALRRSLWTRAESLVWSAWAFALIGAIERKILHIDHLELRHGSLQLRHLPAAARFIAILEDAKE